MEDFSKDQKDALAAKLVAMGQKALYDGEHEEDVAQAINAIAHPSEKARELAAGVALDVDSLRAAQASLQALVEVGILTGQEKAEILAPVALAHLDSLADSGVITAQQKSAILAKASPPKKWVEVIFGRPLTARDIGMARGASGYADG